METTRDFAEYLSDKGYKMLSVQVPNKNGVTAIVIGEPKLSDFTQIKDIGQNAWEVRLSVNDYDNKEIVG